MHPNRRAHPPQAAHLPKTAQPRHRAHPRRDRQAAPRPMLWRPKRAMNRSNRPTEAIGPRPPLQPSGHRQATKRGPISRSRRAIRRVLSHRRHERGLRRRGAPIWPSRRARRVNGRPGAHWRASEPNGRRRCGAVRVCPVARAPPEALRPTHRHSQAVCASRHRSQAAQPPAPQSPHLLPRARSHRRVRGRVAAAQKTPPHAARGQRHSIRRLKGASG